MTPASVDPSLPLDEEAVLATPDGYRAPTALPPAPSQATLVQVLPWLLRLAFGQPQLRWRLGAALILLLGSKAAGLSAPLYFKHAVDALAAGSGGSGALHAAALALLLSGGCRVVAGLAKELQGPVFAPVSQDAGRRVAFYTFAHVLGLDLQFHLNRKTGALSRMLERGARSVAMIFRAIVFTFVPTVLELAAVCVILARAFHPRVSALVLATFACYAAFTVLLTWVAAGIRRRVKELDNEITGKAVDAFLNFETVKLFGNSMLEVRQYDTSLTAYQARRAVVRLDYAAAALNAGQAFILAAGMTVVMLAAALTPGVVTGAGAAGAAGGAITAGDLVMIQGLLLQLWAPLQFLGWFYRELRQSLVDMEDLFTLLRTPTKLPEGSRKLPDAPLERRHSNGATGSSSGAAGSNGAASTRGLRLELRDVRFGYGGKEGRQVLKGVSLVAHPGESVAIVGPSGSGKSTVLRLLVRLYDCDQGQVLLNGVDVRELRQDSLRSAVAVVPQDTVLFNDTILHNVAYGQPGATMAEVRAAAAAAKMDAAVSRMPAGWATTVGERGLKLSGGEKQRVAIARAFLRQPRLLICDEATSALDTATERGIQASLRELAAGRTSVFVAHRLSTVQACDRIYVLSDGRVEEQGTHQELLSARGLYWEMWNLQLAEQELEGHLHTGEEEGGGPASPAARQRTAQQHRGGRQQGAEDLSGSSSSSEDEGGPPRPADAAAGLHQR
ncbi:hypothetical protein ABPG77_007798 [Micractinium sp. CCAP 211/92]